MASVSAFSVEVKELILARTGWACDRCGLRAANGQFHHRSPRRMGGSDNERLGLPSNGVLLHPNCHEYIESRRKIAVQLGFILNLTANPTEWPIYLWKGWHYLNEDGTVTPLDAPPPQHFVPRPDRP